MPDIYEHLKNGNIYYALEECRSKRIHYMVNNIVKMLVASHKSIFREVLEFLVNHINEYIVSETFETLLLTEDCGEKIDIMIDFLRKHKLEWMLFRNTGYLLELAIKYNRLDSIMILVDIIKYYKELYKFTNCFSKINNLNTFKHIIKKCNMNDYIDMNIDDIFYTMLTVGNKEIIMYIIRNYKLCDFNNDIVRYQFNSSHSNLKYYYNIGLRMDMIYNIKNDIILI
jgi:hypothetical protein